MKKLLLGAFLTLGYAFGINAQTTIYFQNFEASKLVAPAGWSTGLVSGHPGNPGWGFNDAFPISGIGKDSLFKHFTPTHTYVAYFDDIDYNTTPSTDYDTLYSAVFNCPSNGHVFLSMDLNFNNYTNAEVGTLLVSTNGGKTWTPAATLPSAYGVTAWQDSTLFNISQYAAGKSNVKVAFAWNNAGAVKQGYPGWGMAIDNVDIYEPLSYDVGVTAVNSNYLLQVGTAYTFNGTILNYGGDSIVSMDMNYKVNNQTPVSYPISGIAGFNGLTSYNWSIGTAFTPATPGVYTIKFYANNLNGSNVDQHHANDTMTVNVMVVDTIQSKQVMFEEFSCASCNPCMYAMPNIDSVSLNTKPYCNTIRYHWYFPGQDMINQETATLVNTRFENYYGQDGVPDAQVDGINYYPGYGPGYLSSGVIQSLKAVGSPFKITINSATYTAATKTYSMTATIKSYGTFSAGLIAQVALTEDSVNFKTDQSTEDPLNSFAPPLGSGSNPDYYYPFVLKFPDAVEALLPSVNGTTLTGFTPGSTQTVTVTWPKSHPWAAKYTSYPYDSSKSQHFTIFIQDNNGNSSMGIPAKYVYQSARAQVPSSITDVPETSTGGINFELYPNPTNNNTMVTFKLDKDQNVSVDVYNMLGEKVYTANQGLMSSGEHMITINGSTLQSGVYFVRFTTDNSSSTQKLVIQK